MKNTMFIRWPVLNNSQSVDDHKFTEEVAPLAKSMEMGRRLKNKKVYYKSMCYAISQQSREGNEYAFCGPCSASRWR